MSALSQWRRNSADGHGHVKTSPASRLDEVEEDWGEEDGRLRNATLCIHNDEEERERWLGQDALVVRDFENRAAEAEAEAAKKKDSYPTACSNESHGCSLVRTPSLYLLSLYSISTLSQNSISYCHALISRL